MVDKLCTQCLSVGTPVTKTPGLFIGEIFVWIAFIGGGYLTGLWLLLLVPLVYSISRQSGQHKECKQCGGRELIPLDTPRAEKLLGEARDDWRGS